MGLEPNPTTPREFRTRKFIVYVVCDLYTLVRPPPSWNGNEVEYARLDKMADSPAGVSTWSKSLACFPPITQQAVDDWADKDAKIPRSKQHKGYSNFIEGYIHDVEGTFTYRYSIEIVHNLSKAIS